VSPNGFVTFSPFAGDTSTNRSLPSAFAPSNSIAFFWDDLDLTSAGNIYCATDSIAGTFTLQFQNAPIKSTGKSVTCQLILKTSGEIILQYQRIGVSNQCTVGIQNAAQTQGLQLAFNQNYLQSGFAVRLKPAPWLGLGMNAGLVPRLTGENINLLLDPTGLAQGSYAATLLVQTTDPALPLTVLPISFNVLAPIDLWRLNHFGTTSNTGMAADSADPDGDGLSNLVEYALGLNPNSPDPNPLSFSLAGRHLMLAYKRPHPAPPDITYISEVANTLGSGAWNSGPTFLNQAVVDNGDGTETVTVTDLADTATAAAHYVRVKFTR